ncbi:hypothetical protein [Thermomicrobium sp.]
MWLIVPVIFLLSWRMTRRWGQALNETVAWIVGYLATAGVLWLTDVGGLDLVDTRPNSPGAILAILGGFLGMLVSRWRWKRRGGHLEPRTDWRKALIHGAARLSVRRSADRGTAVGSRTGSASGSDVTAMVGRLLGRAAANLFVPELRRRNPWFRAMRALVSQDETRQRRP